MRNIVGYTFNNKSAFVVDNCLNCLKNADWFHNECASARDLYMDALNCFNLNKSDVNRANLCKSKLLYKKLIKKKKSCAYRKKMIGIESMKSKSPRDFWKYFNNNVKIKNNGISIDEFKMFFERISNNTSDCNNSEAEQFCSSYDFTEENFAFPELDCPRIVNETLNAIKYLKRNKSADCDCILNEYV
jgi:hypothetical protein